MRPVLLGLGAPPATPTNIDVRVTHQHDSISNVGTYWGTADPVYLISTSASPVKSVLRWANLGIPQGATIIEARITLYVSFDYPAEPNGHVAIGLVQHDNAPRINSLEEHNALASNVGTTIDWGSPVLINQDAPLVSPNLASIVQTVVNRPGFGPTSALQFHATNVPPSAVSISTRSFWNGVPGPTGTMPRLQITYLA